MSIRESSPREGPQSVGRVIAILECVASGREGTSLAELVAHTQAPKTSLVGLLTALVQEGCLRRDASGRYLLADRIHGLAARIGGRQELAGLARPFLRELMLQTGETVVLGVPAGDDDVVVYIDKVESDNPVRYTITVGERREMFCTAMGKALLAYAPADQLRRVLSPRSLRRFTPSTIVSAATLRDELDDIRANGIARTRNERVEGASGLAATVFGPEGEAVAAILVAGPSQRMLAHQRSIERRLAEAARSVTLSLGGVPA